MASKEKNGKKDIISIVIMVVGMIVIVISAYNLWKIMQDYHKSNKLYDNLADEFVTEHPEPVTEAAEEEIPWYELANVDLDQVKAINPDVVGWIYFENEEISYPILYSGDNDTYLRTALDGSSATAGSIFMEGANHPDFQDCHTIIYGHNMKNLSMFGRLKYYKNSGYYGEDHQYFQIFTGDEVYRYEIFAFADVPADSEVYTVPYAPDDAFQEFIDGLYRTSYEDTGVSAGQNDKVVTLSTCSSGDNRFVVHAVRVDAHGAAEEGGHEE